MLPYSGLLMNAFSMQLPQCDPSRTEVPSPIIHGMAKNCSIFVVLQGQTTRSCFDVQHCHISVHQHSNCGWSGWLRSSHLHCVSYLEQLHNKLAVKYSDNVAHCRKHWIVAVVSRHM